MSETNNRPDAQHAPLFDFLARLEQENAWLDARLEGHPTALRRLEIASGELPTPEETSHLHSCTKCKRAVEQLRDALVRAGAALVAAEPDDSEIVAPIEDCQVFLDRLKIAAGDTDAASAAIDSLLDVGCALMTKRLTEEVGLLEVLTDPNSASPSVPDDNTTTHATADAETIAAHSEKTSQPADIELLRNIALNVVAQLAWPRSSERQQLFLTDEHKLRFIDKFVKELRLFLTELSGNEQLVVMSGLQFAGTRHDSLRSSQVAEVLGIPEDLMLDLWEAGKNASKTYRTVA